MYGNFEVSRTPGYLSLILDLLRTGVWQNSTNIFVVTNRFFWSFFFWFGGGSSFLMSVEIYKLQTNFNSQMLLVNLNELTTF